MSTKERPILFTTAMVRAVENDAKTQTRRVVVPTQTKPRIAPLIMEPYIWQGQQELDDDGLPCWLGAHPDYPTGEKWFSCPYGGVGDRLWVRETWTHHFGRLLYRADCDPKSYEYGAKGWKPSIHMPRRLSRLTLEIMGVRVERVQDITEEDAIAEGMQAPGIPAAITNRTAFARLWDTINAKRGYSWAVNPWVWVIEFRRLTGA